MVRRGWVYTTVDVWTRHDSLKDFYDRLTDGNSTNVVMRIITVTPRSSPSESLINGACELTGSTLLRLPCASSIRVVESAGSQHEGSAAGAKHPRVSLSQSASSLDPRYRHEFGDQLLRSLYSKHRLLLDWGSRAFLTHELQ